jgi:hypothetical protein
MALATALITGALAAPVRAFTAGHLQDLFDR